ncbi:MAG: 5'-3' exonuclease [Austwickia sp.]|nr:5'-3' exonuclease [Austwickia sp.]MBK8435277.1 5'-3' exonuclease [Austwickia sp.]MBK9101171.1 5'-3' exonuclease [Austwickia sp.]
MLLDAASLYFRAFFGVPDQRRTPQEPASNAVRGFLDMIATLVSAHRPGALVACWDDDWRPAFRVAAIPTYKSHRLANPTSAAEEVPDELAPQVPVIAAALAAVGIARLGCPGFEADDVIGTLTTRATGRCPVRIVTGDRDLFQLVDDAADIAVLYTAKGGVREATVVDQAYLQATYGVPTGSAYADLATLRGDSSDGLPGVRGIGEKTAAVLIGRYGSLEGLQAALAAGDPALKGAQRTRLLEAADYLRVAPSVVQVARDAPLPEVTGALPTEVADVRVLSELAVSHNLAGPFTRLLTALGLS